MRVKVIDIDPNYKLYIYSKKSVLKKRVNGRWMSVIVARDYSEMLNSFIIDFELKKKIKQKIEHIR